MATSGKVSFNGVDSSGLPCNVDVTAHASTLAAAPVADYKVVDVGDNSTTVSAVPAVLYGVYVNTVLSNHELPIKDATTTVVTIPAQAAAGSIYTFPGIKFTTSLIVDPNDAATGSITVAYSV